MTTTWTFCRDRGRGSGAQALPRGPGRSLAERPPSCAPRAGCRPRPLPPAPPPAPHLDLLEGDLEAEGLVEVRVERLLLHRRLLLLEPLAVLHQVDLHVGVCGEPGPQLPSARPPRPSAQGTRGGVQSRAAGQAPLVWLPELSLLGRLLSGLGRAGGLRRDGHPPALLALQMRSPRPQKGRRRPKVTPWVSDRAGLAARPAGWSPSTSCFSGRQGRGSRDVHLGCGPAPPRAFPAPSPRACARELSQLWRRHRQRVLSCPYVSPGEGESCR